MGSIGKLDGDQSDELTAWVMMRPAWDTKKLAHFGYLTFNASDSGVSVEEFEEYIEDIRAIFQPFRKE